MRCSRFEWLRIQKNSAGNTFATKSINRSRLMLAALLRFRDVTLLPTLNRKFPAVAVGIVKPQTHVGRAGPFRADFVARILKIGTDTFQVIERFSQRGHVRQMKRHVIDRFRRWFAFEQRDRDVVVANRDAVIEIEFLFQPQSALEPFRAFLWIAHG